MRFGFHISIAQGFVKALQNALRLQCQTIQLFSQNPRGWKYKQLDRDDIATFKVLRERSGITPVAVHMPYLPNLASCNRELYEKSLDLLCENLRRAQVIGAQYLVAHPGNYGDRYIDEAIERVAAACNQAFSRIHNNVVVLLENTAGQGTEIGSAFSQLQKIIRAVKQNSRLGICLDTAHAFAAGYNIATSTGLQKTVAEFEKHIGRSKLYLLHLNDSRSHCGSRIDRHWHIGKGCIGFEGFHRIVNHSFFKDLPGIMETPQQSDKDDRTNMKTIMSLVKK